MNNGANLERYLGVLHANYRRLGLCHIVKVPTPMCITGNHRGKITGHLERPVYVDFTGVLAGGIAVALEAKCTTGDKPSFPLSKISPGQRDVLTSVHGLGGVAAVFARRLSYGGRYGKLSTEDYLVPVSYIDGLERKSFRWDAVQKYRIPAGKTWIDALDLTREIPYGEACPFRDKCNGWWVDYERDGWQ